MTLKINLQKKVFFYIKTVLESLKKKLELSGLLASTGNSECI